MFELSLIFTALMVLTALIPFRARSHAWCVFFCLAWVLAWGFIHLVNSHLRFVPAVGWLYAFLIIAFPIARSLKLNWIGFQSIGVACALVAYGIAMYQYLPAYYEHQELLSKHPAIDLKPRLADERPFTRASNLASGEPQSPANGDASPMYDARSLSQLDEAFQIYLNLGSFRMEYKKRDRRLAFQGLMQVHEGFVGDFIAQPGVGRSRLPGVKLLRKASFIDVWEDVSLDDPPEVIEQPDTPAPKSYSPDDAHLADVPSETSPRLSGTASAPIPTAGYRDYLQGLHFQNVANFVPLYSLGGVNTQLQARGFNAHAFHASPVKLGWESSPIGWRLSRLELVSLLKHRPSAVYVSDHLPAMDELRDAPTRALTSFESEAITRLANGEDLVAEVSRDGELAMVGSIRAIADCRDCHRVPVGGLLGAFSYRLKPRSDSPQTSRDEAKQVPPATSPAS